MHDLGLADSEFTRKIAERGKFSERNGRQSRFGQSREVDRAEWIKKGREFQMEGAAEKKDRSPKVLVEMRGLPSVRVSDSH